MNVICATHERVFMKECTKCDDINFVRLVKRSRTKSNKVEQGGTKSNKVKQVISILFDRGRLCSTAIKVKQGRLKSNKVEQSRYHLLGGTSFFKSSYPILCKMLIGHFISTFCSTFAKSVQDVHWSTHQYEWPPCNLPINFRIEPFRAKNNCLLDSK